MISRILVVTLILILGGFVIFAGELDENTQEVLGSSTTEVVDRVQTDSNFVDANEEINRLLQIIEKRPDYAAAWLRLAALYEQIGEKDRSEEARATARGLNPDLH